jgi:hypothetical protein
MIPKGMWPLVIGFPGLELLFQELNLGSPERFVLGVAH